MDGMDRTEVLDLIDARLEQGIDEIDAKDVCGTLGIPLPEAREILREFWEDGLLREK